VVDVLGPPLLYEPLTDDGARSKMAVDHPPPSPDFTDEFPAFTRSKTP
jgi:hypothetical protein